MEQTMVANIIAVNLHFKEKHRKQEKSWKSGEESKR